MTRRRRGRASEGRPLALMLLPYLLGLWLLIAGPALFTFGLAFTNANLIRPPSYVGLANFRNLLHDVVFRIALSNSLRFLAWSVSLRVLGAVLLALLLCCRGRMVSVERTSVLVPVVLPDVAYALVWLWILNPLYGPLNLVLEAVGIHGPAWLSQPGPARAGVVIMSVFLLGEGFVIALVARLMVPPELGELAVVEGAGLWQRFRRITLPLMLPALLLLLARDAIFSFQTSFVPALLVTGGGPPRYSTTYLPLFLYRNAFEYLRYGYAAAGTLFMISYAVAIVWLLLGPVAAYLLLHRAREASRLGGSGAS